LSAAAGPRGFLARLVRDKPLGAIGGAVFLVFLFCGVFADFLAPHGLTRSAR
jgi:peptide/nickel transport system permease protein